MTPISLMPPVDYCPSCEGRKAQDQAQDIGEARARQIELQSTVEAASTQPNGAPPVSAVDPAAEGDQTKPVNGAVQPLLAPDLVVQASLARPSIDGSENGDAAALRLRSAQAYGGF